MRSLSDYTQEELADNRDWQGGRVIYTPRHVTLARAAGGGRRREGMEEGSAIREKARKETQRENESLRRQGKEDAG